MLSALRDGFRGLGRNWGLVVLVLLVNVALALVLAAPLALQLNNDLSQSGASFCQKQSYARSNQPSKARSLSMS